MQVVMELVSTGQPASSLELERIGTSSKGKAIESCASRLLHDLETIGLPTVGTSILHTFGILGLFVSLRLLYIGHPPLLSPPSSSLPHCADLGVVPQGKGH